MAVRRLRKRSVMTGRAANTTRLTSPVTTRYTAASIHVEYGRPDLRTLLLAEDAAVGEYSSTPRSSACFYLVFIIFRLTYISPAW